MKLTTFFLLCLFALSYGWVVTSCSRANVLDEPNNGVESPCADKRVISFRCTNCLFEGFFDAEKQISNSVDDGLLYSWACSSPSFQPKFEKKNLIKKTTRTL
jgi:hypothetical protein